MNIYLVNSHPAIRAALKNILIKSWPVFEFDSGISFLETIKKDEAPTAVVLLDMNIPTMNGLTVMEYMKHNKKLKEYPVIFITENNDKKIELSCLEQGASDYISFPFNPEIIHQRVEKVVNQHRAYVTMISEIRRTSILTPNNFDSVDKKVTYQVLVSLASTIDAKDFYTRGHSSRVAEYSLLIGRELGMPHNELEILYYGALLHDIGKIGVSDVILRKESELSTMEFNIIKEHPLTGYSILKSITLMPEIAQCARWHHERYDGKGYPDGLKGIELPLPVRIISIADAFDAMTSDRTYRKATSVKATKKELENNKGLQFDPYIADIMCELINDGTIKEKMNQGL